MAVAAGAADPIPVDTRNYTDIASDGDETSDMGEYKYKADILKFLMSTIIYV